MAAKKSTTKKKTSKRIAAKKKIVSSTVKKKKPAVSRKKKAAKSAKGRQSETKRKSQTQKKKKTVKTSKKKMTYDVLKSEITDAEIDDKKVLIKDEAKQNRNKKKKSASSKNIKVLKPIDPIELPEKPSTKVSENKTTRRFPIQFKPILYTTSLLLSISLVTMLSYFLFLFTRPLAIEYIDIDLKEVVCVEGYFPYPSIYESHVSDEIAFTFSNETILFDRYSIMAQQFCIKPKQLLDENADYEVKLFIPNLPFTTKTLAIKPSSYANIVIPEYDFVEDGVNLSQTLDLKLNSSNTLFDYHITIDDVTARCTVLGLNVSCPMDELELEQGETYYFAISSTFDGKELESLYHSEVRIKTPTKLVSSSIESETTILNHSPNFIFTFSKELSEISGVSIQSVNEDEYEYIEFDDYDITVTAEGNEIEVDVPSQLPPNSEYLLTIQSIVATDQSFLENPIEIVFYTSNGPTVNYINTTAIQFPTYENIVLGFDEELDTEQDVHSKVTLSPAVDYSAVISGSSIIINPKSNLDSCKVYSVTVSSGIISNYDVLGTNSYSKSFKTPCARVGVIGTSVQGRSIYSYYLGTGAKKILFYGAMHGSEANSKILLDYWIDELEKNYNSIPSDVTVIVVPSLNPDGVTAGTRFNANEVDLNRNFDTSDWQAETDFLGDTYPEGGGTAPFSEPESVAIRNLINAQNPYLTLSYHSAAAYVIPNQLSTSATYGQKYAQLSGYQYVAPTVDDAFEYSITGSFGKWTSENSKPSLIIELSTHYYSETGTNFPAMWGMVE